jgi:ATP-binding cassette, subfamily B, multidrug efflux pump
MQEQLATRIKPGSHTNGPNAPTLAVPRGEIEFDGVRFRYGRELGVLQDFTLTVRSGKENGLIGRSGAGKSTAVNLLLRIFDVEAGRIRH